MSAKLAVDQPWFDGASTNRSGEAVVLGGGLAGAATARALAERGVDVTVIERGTSPGKGASGNPAAVVLPLPALEESPLSRFFLHAYRQILETIARFNAEGVDLGWRPHGVIHLPARRKIVKQIGRLKTDSCPPDVARVINSEEASLRSGLPINSKVLFYERGGFLRPAALCKAWLDHPRIRCRFETTVARIHCDKAWHLDGVDQKRLVDTQNLIIATGHRLASFAPLHGLPLAISGGRLMTVPSSWCDHSIQSIVCHKGYLLPMDKDRLLLGATWHEPKSPTNPDPAAHRELIEEAECWIPGFRGGDLTEVKERFAYRAKTDDHLPIAGPAPKAAAFMQAYEGLHHGRPDVQYPAGRYWPGLFICGGLGARGVVASGLAGEVTAAAVTGSGHPLPADLVQAVHPARFIIRDLRRKPEDRRLHVDLAEKKRKNR